jgi:flagellar M-ring protein FliF
MNYAAQPLAFWNGLSKRLRSVVVVFALGATGLAIVAAVLAHPSRSALFATPLHAEQLAEVQERLASWNVIFTPTADNVIIDASRRSDLLLRLSLAGVPHDHLETTGEALAGVGVLTPQAVIDAQTRAGLAGDLESGLRGVDGIDDARIIVAPAKPAEFADETSHDASASVRLRLRSGYRLSRETIDGIRAFVAAGVTGLSPARVTILDDRGVALSEGSNGDEAIGLQGALQSALDQAFGEGAAIVRVNAEYGAEDVAQRDVRRQSVGTQPIGRSARNDSYVDGAKRYRHVEESDDRGSEMREIVTQAHAGGIKRVSTAVFVDSSRAIELASVRELAAATVGFDARRGDTLVVAAVDFHRAPVARKDVWWLLYGAIVPLLPAIAIALALVAAARYAITPIGSFLQRWLESTQLRKTTQAVAGFTPSRVRGALAGEPPHAAAAIISALPAATAAAVLDLYPPHEREAIVRRMQRPQSPLLSDPEEFLRRHA